MTFPVNDLWCHVLYSPTERKGFLVFNSLFAESEIYQVSGGGREGGREGEREGGRGGREGGKEGKSVWRKVVMQVEKGEGREMTEGRKEEREARMGNVLHTQYSQQYTAPQETSHQYIPPPQHGRLLEDIHTAV